MEASAHEFTPVLTLVVLATCVIVGPLAATRIRLPSMVGLVLAGTIVGPHVLGWLPDGSLDALGAVGLLYLMFQAGLELDLAVFDKNRRSALLFGSLTFAVPLALGSVAGLAVGLTPVAAILIGSVWASHTLVTFPDVREAGLTANRAVTAAVGATVLTDTLALLVLATIASSVRGGGIAQTLAGLTAKIGLLGVYALWILPRLGRRFFMGHGQQRTTRFVFLMLGLFSAAYLSTRWGIEGLVGAFLAGLGLNRVVPNGGELMERVEFFGSALLIPIFLVYVGTELNPAAVVDPATMLVALAFLAALVIGKLLAAAVAGGLLRFSLAETGVMFGMSLPQAAATLAATIVGARLGLFSSQIVSSVVLVVLVSLLVGSLATRMAAARVSVAEGRETALGRRVLCAVRDTATAERLAHLAALVAARDCGTVVPVVFSLAPAKVGEREHDLLQLAETAATAAGNDVAGRVRSANSFVSGVRSATAEESPSSVVLGWQKSSALDMQFLGTELDRVGRLIDEPLLAARFDTEIVERVLVFLDARPRSGSRIPSALIALDVAERIADGTGCPLEIVSTRRTDVDHLVESLDVHDFKHRVIDGGPIAANLGFARGDLLVMTPASYRGWLGRASLDAVDGLSLLIAAEAGAMRVSNAGTSREVVLGWERPT